MNGTEFENGIVRLRSRRVKPKGSKRGRLHAIRPDGKALECRPTATLESWEAAPEETDPSCRKCVGITQHRRSLQSKPPRCTACGSTAPHHVKNVLETGQCVL